MTNNKHQTTNTKQPTTDNRQQITRNKQQTTPCQVEAAAPCPVLLLILQQTANNRQQTTNTKQQTTDTKQQITSNQQQTTPCQVGATEASEGDGGAGPKSGVGGPGRIFGTKPLHRGLHDLTPKTWSAKVGALPSRTKAPGNEAPASPAGAFNRQQQQQPTDNSNQKPTYNSNQRPTDESPAKQTANRQQQQQRKHRQA